MAFAPRLVKLPGRKAILRFAGMNGSLSRCKELNGACCRARGVPEHGGATGTEAKATMILLVYAG